MVAGKECLRLIPNVHPVTLLLLLATAVYGAKALYPAFGFALLEIALYGAGLWNLMYLYVCLLYTSDAADELDGVDLGGRRII